MKTIEAGKPYTLQEIKPLLNKCFICQNDTDIAYWSQISRATANQGDLGIACKHCSLSLSFTFPVTPEMDIIDEHLFNSIKMSNFEIKNNKGILTIYRDNTYISNMKDAEKLSLDDFVKLSLLT